MITVTCTFLMKWHFNKDARGFEPMIFEFRQDVSILLLECGYYRIYWTCSKKQLNDAVVSWPQKIIKIAGGDNFWLLTIIMPAPLPHKPFVLNSLWLCQFSGYLNLKTKELKMRYAWRYRVFLLKKLSSEGCCELVFELLRSQKASMWPQGQAQITFR